MRFGININLIYFHFFFKIVSWILVSRRSKLNIYIILRDLLDFKVFVESNFPAGKMEINRERLFQKIFALVPQKNKISVFEYGVAHGYLTSYLLKRFDKKISVWHGFDTFVGLPNSWRSLPKSHFDNGGIPPEINDERISWHIGYVENTLANEIFPKSKEMNLHIFDLDLFEPSLFVWNSIKDNLKNGDILYFDEAFDDSERRLLTEYILKNYRCEYIGSTVLALALRFIGPIEFTH
jgi:hypothetical protein